MKERPMYLDKLGRPLTLLEWAALMEDREYQQVAYNEFPATTKCEPSSLSTVWLGLDHNLWPGPPHIFETMRFTLRRETRQTSWGSFTHRVTLTFPDPDDNAYRCEQTRWSTEEQARLGHARIVRLIQELEMQ